MANYKRKSLIKKLESLEKVYSWMGIRYGKLFEAAKPMFKS